MPIMAQKTPLLDAQHQSLPISIPTGVPPLGIDSPARTLLTDFTTVRAQTVTEKALASVAREVMHCLGVRLLLVVDTSGLCTGIISARELFGGRRITQAMQRFDIPRHEVSVGMIKTPCQDLHTLSLSHLSSLTVGDLVEALKAFGDQHLLVTDHDQHQQQRIRGVISASDVGRALSLDLGQQPPEARNFIDICRVILGREL
ncbi:hypothetical protein [Litchfieldella rifensis]|uniref:CBS domain-containing protein n=1 Tax=Litchfieldella rifensis TaxID=762643 RepID=A0ABV7LML4_9GAMM